VNNLINNYFEAELSIAQRLKQEVPNVLHILTPFSVGDMVESSQPSPSIHIIYGGDSVTGELVGQGSSKFIDQKWLVVLAVRTAAAQLQNTSDIRLKAGEIIPLILNSLQGWKPVKWMRPLARISGPPAGYSSSFAYFPFMFEGRIIT
jgi:hypothetical protein